MVNVGGGPAKITIQFTQEIPNGTYQVSVSGGPTSVDPFSVTLDGTGSGTYTIPPKGTSSALQAGTYQVTITGRKFSEMYNPIVGQ